MEACNAYRILFFHQMFYSIGRKVIKNIKLFQIWKENENKSVIICQNRNKL